MLGYIWSGLMITAVVFGGITGRTDMVTQAMIGGTQTGLEIFLVLLGMMCLWNGIMEIADKSGFSLKFSRLLWPLLSVLFPGVKRDSAAAEAISMNVAANIFGLGNAATPLGLRAIKELDEENRHSPVASDNMIMFVVLNSVSVQLVPTGVAALRSKYGSSSAMDIIPAVWIASVLSLCAAVLATTFLSRVGKIKK